MGEIDCEEGVRSLEILEEFLSVLGKEQDWRESSDFTLFLAKYLLSFAFR